MPSDNAYDTEGFVGTLDFSAQKIKFQTSIIITQDANKSGILSFLTEVEQTSAPSPSSTSSQTIRVSDQGTGYP